MRDWKRYMVNIYHLMSQDVIDWSDEIAWIDNNWWKNYSNYYDVLYQVIKFLFHDDVGQMISISQKISMKKWRDSMDITISHHCLQSIRLDMFLSNDEWKSIGLSKILSSTDMLSINCRPIHDVTNRFLIYLDTIVSILFNSSIQHLQNFRISDQVWSQIFCLL